MRRLRADGHSIRIADYARNRPDETAGIEFLANDLRDYDAARTAVKGCSHVIHLAAIVGGIGNFHKFPFTLLENNHGLYNAIFRAAID